jgi:hypothetical protein
MSAAHHTRSHATWAASATTRNVTCAGAVAMETMCEDKETEAAAWGTCAHQIAERCLRQNIDASSFLGETEKSGRFEFVIDEEMANCSQVYVAYCRDRMAEYRAATGQEATMWVEQQLSLAPLDPPLKAGGTGDCGMHFPLWRMLEVVDLKGGRGVVVKAAGNMQERTYAIGFLLSLVGISVDTIRSTIVQPRVGDGKPTWEDVHVADLLDWTVDLLAAMRRSRQALTEFEALGGNRVKFDDWAERWLTVGACVFCPAEGVCPKRRKEALSIMSDTAQRWFEEPAGDAPLAIGNAPETASPEELARWLDGLEALESWIKSLRAYAHAAAERGVAIPGWIIVDKIGNRRWTDETQAALALRNTLGLSKEQAFEEKLRSPAQIEKILGAKRKAEIEPLVSRPATGTNLVSAAKTSRSAAKSLAEQHNDRLEHAYPVNAQRS